MRLSDLVAASEAVRRARARRQKITVLAELIRRLDVEELPAAVGLLAGEPRAGKVGVGWATVADLRGTVPPSAEPQLGILELDHALAELATISGRGSIARREAALGSVLARATTDEQGFLERLLVGELRQGALDAIVVDAIAKAFEREGAAVRRGYMLTGDLGRVALAARAGAADLGALELEPMRPVLPMLASPATDVEEALGDLGEAGFEIKIDGARVQIHRQGERIAVYTRSLHEVTHAVPEVVETIAALPIDDLVLDGEVIAMRHDGRPHPFQTTMRRFGRKLDVEGLRRELPLSLRVFDTLRLSGITLIDAPARDRWAALEQSLPAPLLVPRIQTSEIEVAEAFWTRALAEGHEGVMAKSLTASYEAGRRGKAWRKLKPAHTFDLVVLAAEWGSGRRQGWLSNLHLGARDPNGSFVMLGKTFKGLTDDMLAWQTAYLTGLEIGREGHVVHVRPELVVEIAFSDVQVSPHYPGGVALRFARVKRHRPDKSAAEADTIDAVRRLLPA